MSAGSEINKFIRRVKRSLKEIGITLEPVGTTSRGKRKYRCVNNQGKSAFWNVSNTPSDQNATKSAVKELRKILNTLVTQDTSSITWNYVTDIPETTESIWDILAEYD